MWLVAKLLWILLSLSVYFISSLCRLFYCLLLRHKLFWVCSVKGLVRLLNAIHHRGHDSYIIGRPSVTVARDTSVIAGIMQPFVVAFCTTLASCCVHNRWRQCQHRVVVVNASSLCKLPMRIFKQEALMWTWNPIRRPNFLLLPTALAREIIQLHPSFCPSVCFHSIFRADWPLALIFCTCVGHYHGSHGIETEGHKSRSGRLTSVLDWGQFSRHYYVVF